MGKTVIPLYRGLFVVIILSWIGSACNSKLVSLPPTSPASPMPATHTPVPPTPTPILPTLTPTATPIPSPEDYLLTLKDVPTVFDRASFMDEYYDGDGNLNYRTLFFMVGITQTYRLVNLITIAKQPWIEIPVFTRYGGEPVESSPVGQGSQAFDQGSSHMSFVFFKGRLLVSLDAFGFDLETIVNLAKLIEARLPENFTTPFAITFPEPLDTTLFTKYFKTVNLGKEQPGTNDLESMTVFSSQDWGVPCWEYEAVADAQKVVRAIYDVQTSTTIYKMERFFGLVAGSKGFGGCLNIPLSAGQYEFRVSVDDALVAALPFEVR